MKFGFCGFLTLSQIIMCILGFFFPREERRQKTHVSQGSIGSKKSDVVEQQLIIEYVMFSLIFLNKKVVLQSTLALQMMISRPAVQWLGETLF